jgi:hypothetical protein
MTPAMLNDKYMIRFCVNAQHATEDDMFAAWLIIKTAAEKIIKDYNEKSQILNLGLSDKCVEIDSLVDLSKMRRQCFVRMVSDPCKDKISLAPYNDSFKHLNSNILAAGSLPKKRVSRLKTFQCNSADIKESIAEELKNTTQ